MTLLPLPHNKSGGGGFYSGAVFNLRTTVVGAGIMALPAIVRVLGPIPGLLAIVAAAALAQRSLDFVFRVGRSSSYADAVGDALGEVGRRLLLGCVAVNNFGMLVVCMIIVGGVLSGATSPEGEVHHRGVLEEWFGTQYWWNDRDILLSLTSVLVSAPLFSFKLVDSLKSSALSKILTVVFVLITAGIAIVKVINGSISMPRLDQVSFWKLFTTVSVLVTAYICYYSLHPIENDLRDPIQMKSIVYIATSFFGFLLFREKTLDVVLVNFDTDFGFVTYGSLLNDMVRVNYAVQLMLLFPSIFCSLELDIADLLFPRAAPLAIDSEGFSVITFVLMVLVFLGANFVSSIWFAFQITGATASVAIGLLFPAAIALRDVHGTASRNDKALSWLMILVAVSSSTVAVASGVYGLFNNGDDS